MAKKKAPKNLSEVRFMMAELMGEIRNKEIDPTDARNLVSAASVIAKITATEFIIAQAAGVVKKIDLMSNDFSKPISLTGLALAEVSQSH